MARQFANGFPVPALAGRAEILDHFAKGVVHGGTYNANPIAMAATVATLKEFANPGFYETMERRGRSLMEGLGQAFDAAKVPAVISGLPHMFSVALEMPGPPRDYREAVRANKGRDVTFTTRLLRRGVRALERGAWFMSSEHDDAVVDATVAAANEAALEI